MRKTITLLILVILVVSLLPEMATVLAQDSGDDPIATFNQCGYTGAATSGPYYISGTPETDNLNTQELDGQAMMISGTVYDGSSGEPVPGAQIEVWQTDANGSYWPDANGDAADFDAGDLNLRGTVIAGEDGTYEFTSIEPGVYPGRPRHIHYRISADGYLSIFTQTYWADDVAVQADRADPDVEDCRMLRFEETEDGATAATFNIYLEPDPNAVATTAVEMPEFALLNLNTASSDDFLTIPGMGTRMVREFEAYRPYVSIAQFRREIGRYVDDARVAAYETYVYVPVDVNESDAETLKQLPGVADAAASALIAARPYASNAAFLDALAEVVSPTDAALAAFYLEAE